MFYKYPIKYCTNLLSLHLIICMSLLTVKRAKRKAQATYQWDILIRVDQLTSCTRGGEGGRLTGHCGWGFSHSAARGVRRGRSGRGDRGLGVGGKCCFWRFGGGGCAVGVWSCSSWSTLLGLYTNTVHGIRVDSLAYSKYDDTKHESQLPRVKVYSQIGRFELWIRKCDVEPLGKGNTEY